MTFSGRFLLNMIQFALQRGGIWNDLIAATNHSYHELEKEACRVSYKAYDQTLKLICDQTNDPLFGLHAGEYMNMSAAGIIGQITQTSSTVKEALDYCCEFANLGCRAIPLTLKEEKLWFKLSFTPDPIWQLSSPNAAKQTVDGLMVFTIREFHNLTRQKYFPQKITLASSDQLENEEYLRVFECPVSIGDEENAMYFKKEHIHQPITTSDYKLLRVLVNYASEKLKAIDQQEGFHGIVRKSIINMVRPQYPTIEQVAANLNTSVRTVQRKLSAEGYNFRHMIEKLRMEFAYRYLSDESLSINEISYLLSYSEPSAFIRSFKRWEGITPNTYRKKHK